jgi:hypothetical protein
MQNVQPIIVHAHIPKTAGTSVNELLQSNFGDDHLSHWTSDPVACLSLADFQEILDQRPTLRSISSHRARFIWPQIGDRTTLPITFLRDPTCQFLSLLRFTRREFNTMPDEVKKWWPTNTPELGLRDLADSYLRNVTRDTGSDQLCQQTRFFCPLNYSEPLFSCGSTEYGHNSFWTASGALERFFFIGLVEEMEASVQLLRAKLKRYGIELIVSAPIWANRTLESESLDWLNEDDPIGRRVLSANRNDERLYRRFAERFQNELSYSLSGWY